ncbi:THxN family PEP-CTERM protein [Colwellia sp. TT2012]|uniref:THxN family PEP-CTERM protein n=1 Tax=Colwellia sp. TT2012 TaxID=1720342 RepID=UPI00070F4AAC|nr:THxN family PEP-CTERM protein [Colwellia sp. TT2012]
MNTLKKFITAVIISTLGFAFTTSATPITSWNWEVNSAFSDFEPSTDVTGEINNAWWNAELTDDAPTILYWGCETKDCANETNANNEDKDISSLDVSSGSAGMLSGTNLENGDSVITASLTHKNNDIWGDSLLTATLSTKLFLIPSPNAAVDTGIPPILFEIVFKETPNDNDCVYDGVLGMPLCQNDIFVVDGFGIDTGGNVVFNPFTNTFNQQFGLGMYTYNIELMIDTLATLHDDICARVGDGAAGCIGVTTLEGNDNTFNVNMTITQVPEPSTILLMSLALFGIVASMRNKHI